MGVFLGSQRAKVGGRCRFYSVNSVGERLTKEEAKYLTYVEMLRNISDKRKAN